MPLALAHVAAAPAQSSQVFILPPGTTALPAAVIGDLPAAATSYVAKALADEQSLFTSTTLATTTTLWYWLISPLPPR